MTSWATRLPQLRAVYERAQHDPFLRGRASTTIGVALLADGLVGLENPLGGRDRRPGVFGAAFIALLGLGIVIALTFAIHASSPYPEGHVAQGTITAVQRHQSNSNTICSGTVAYQANDQNFTIGSDVSSKSLCSQVGQHVPVSWTPANPGAGRPQFAETNWVLHGFMWLGWFVFVIGLFTLLLRVAELVVGIIMLARGRRLTRSAPPTEIGRLLDDLRSAWAGTYTNQPA